MKALIFFISLSLLVVTHEMGHLLFAKLFHTRVRRFYVFFNPWFSIIKAKKFNGKWHFRFFNATTPEEWDEKNLKPEDQDNTLWGLGWLPLGGFCDIAGMIDETKGADDLESTPQPWEYRTKPRWQRLCIIAGGVLVNFVSALIIYTGIFAHWGTDDLPLRNAKLGYAYHQILLDEGFQDGDIIYAIDEEEMFDFATTTQKLILDKPNKVTVLRGDSLVVLQMSKDLLSKIASENPKQIMAARWPFVVKDFAPGSVGKHYGMQVGDSLVSINGIATPTAVEFTTTLGDFAGDSAVIGLYRNGLYTEVPALLGSDGKLGIFAMDDMSKIFEVRHNDYTFWQAIPAGISYGWETLVSYVSSLKILFTKGGTKSLGGFITMASLFPDTWDWLRFWNLTALLAVVLAFMNIIPIPGLDGGHIVITLWEMITRKPVSEKVLNVIQNIGLFLLLALMVIANGNDLIRVFGGWFR
ncbi:MAG: RIP metalloprotease RseP [Bacteroidales bacterium]|nr:RIP metalloprotease RseP [Candidatus Colimorpha merdihippi]